MKNNDSPDSDSKRSETVRVTEVLRNEIIDGDRLPGSRLVERNLATELGVSRVPVREALKQLASEGLVVNRPNTWSTVREFSPSDIADLNEVRAVFDILSFELAAQRHNREGLARLEATMAQGRDLSKAGDVVGAHRSAADFHAIVTELSGNRLLVEIGELLDSRMRWQLSQHDDLDFVATEHAQLYDAIAHRDQSKVRDLAARHLGTSQEQHDKHKERLARGVGENANSGTGRDASTGGDAKSDGGAGSGVIEGTDAGAAKDDHDAPS